MSGADHYLLGNSALYTRLCIITEVLCKFVSSAPRAMSIAQLEQQTGQTARDLTRLCNALCRAQLLEVDASQPQSWQLARDASEVTLEDAFRCAVEDDAKRTRGERHKQVCDQMQGSRHEVDLLVMQAAMGINQNVCHYLRQFSLDRLKVAAAGRFPSQSGRGLYPRLSFS